MDWVRWHDQYDDPESSLSRRLEVVKARIGMVLNLLPAGPIRVLGMCSGDGRDIFPVLAAHPRRTDVSGRLVELDETLSGRARELAPPGIEVVKGDAGDSQLYEAAAPANLVLCCGVLGNISDADVKSTIASWRFLCSPEAYVVWTRAGDEVNDLRQQVRDWVASSGFREVTWDGDPPETYGVGVAQFVAQPESFRRVRMFTFGDGGAQ